MIQMSVVDFNALRLISNDKLRFGPHDASKQFQKRRIIQQRKMPYFTNCH